MPYLSDHRIQEFVSEKATLPQYDDGDYGEDKDDSLVLGRNPMLNPVVLRRLFELCDLSDLFRFRLVTKLWHSTSLNRFRKEMMVVICHPTKWISKQSSECSNDPGAGVENHLRWKWDELAALRDNPFNSFRIKHAEFGRASGTQPGDDLDQMNQRVDQFWGKYGSWIRKLELWNPQVHSVDAFRTAIFEEMPNLEELHLIEIIHQAASDALEEDVGVVKVQRNLKRLVVKTMSTLPFTWSLLFLHFPNIQSIEVTPNHLDSSSIATLTRDLTEISSHLRRKADSKFTLPNLFLQLWTLEEANLAINLLKIPLLTLGNLTISLEYFDDGDEARTFLSTAFLLHGHTLEKLRMTDAQPRTSPFENFPFQMGTFGSLTTLNLRGDFCKNLHFLEHFPNLQQLELTTFASKIVEDSDSTRMEKVELRHLRWFRFAMTNRIPPRTMELFVKMMPNVEIFYGALSNSSLRVICRDWRQLKSLRIRSFSNLDDKYLDDEGITGILAGAASEEPLPNITDLQELKYLSFQITENISDSSVWNGFLKMPQLQSLIVELRQTSDEAFKALAKRFPNGQITRCNLSIPYKWVS